MSEKSRTIVTTILPLLFTLLSSHIAMGQTYTTTQLLRCWSYEDKTQTLQAEKTYLDLKAHLDTNRLKKLLPELNQYVASHPKKLRLKIRIKMYEILAPLDAKSRTKPEDSAAIKNLFGIALQLKDLQLLSELYTLYEENSSGAIEDNFFYLTKAIDIQQSIGASYFPKLYLRLLKAGIGYYNLGFYNVSIRYFQECQQYMGSPRTNVIMYVLALDYIGASFYAMQQPDSGILSYRHIKHTLADYRRHFSQYEDGFQNYSKRLDDIWDGIADGGIGIGLAALQKTEEAIPL